MSPDDNSFSVKLGSWFEAKAQGRFAIVAVAILATVAVAAKATGLW